MGTFVDNMKASPLFWEGAFLLAFILLIGAHKISIEGMIE
jgi:hypothetical protein